MPIPSAFCHSNHTSMYHRFTSSLLFFLPVLRNHQVMVLKMTILTITRGSLVFLNVAYRARRKSNRPNVSERYYINVCLIPPHRTRQVSFRETRELHDCIPQAGKRCPLRGRPGSNLHADVHWQRSSRHEGRQWFSNPMLGHRCLSALALTQGKDRAKLIISTYSTDCSLQMHIKQCRGTFSEADLLNVKR